MENFNAQDAAALAIQNEQPLDKKLETIKNVAACGGRSILFSEVSYDQIIELTKLGFTLRTFTDPMGLEQLKVSW